MPVLLFCFLQDLVDDPWDSSTLTVLAEQRKYHQYTTDRTGLVLILPSPVEADFAWSDDLPRNLLSVEPGSEIALLVVIFRLVLD